MSPRYQFSGFTLIELIVTMAVAAIIAAVAIPSFSRLIANNQVATDTNRLLSTLQFAHSEAVLRGGVVSVSAISSNFGNGWCVHTGSSCTSTSEIRKFGAQSADFSSSNNVNKISFSRRGERADPNQDANNPKISVKSTRCASGDSGRQSEIEVGVSGRARLNDLGDC